MLAKQSGQSGVTLVELIVTILIAAILAGIAVPSFSGWLQSLKVRAATESVLGGMQIARSEALRRNTFVQFVLGTGAAWTVGCVTITVDCPANIQASAAGEGGNGGVTLTATPDGATTLIFNNFGSIVASGASITQLDLDIAPTGQGRNLRITASAGGAVRMCDPNKTAPDPRAC